MKTQRLTVTLGVMVAALLVWLVVRSHLSSPGSHPTTGNAPTATPGPAPGNIVATYTPSTDAATALNTPAGPTATTATQELRTPAQTPGPSALPNGSIPIASSATTASAAESASINAIRVRRMVTDYHTLTGENPVGTNAEIMAALMGKNSRQAVLGPPDGLSLNAKGELVDDWGTPYFFHQLSKDVMEIHSAGPDRIMGTADDVIVR